MPVSPILERQTTYPFVRLNEAARRVEARGIEVIDFGTGDPREPTDPLIRQALVDGLRDRMGYPAAVGLPELREAIAAWAQRRFGATLDPDTEVIPTLGSKEAIFSFALAVVDADGTRDTVAYTDPGYPVYERGALFAHARPLAAAAARGARLPARPRRDRRRDVGAARRLLGQLSEQPDLRHGAALLLRAARRARAGARLRARLRRGVHGALVRPAARVGAAARRPDERRRLQHALEAQLDDRATGAASRPAIRR